MHVCNYTYIYGAYQLSRAVPPALYLGYAYMCEGITITSDQYERCLVSEQPMHRMAAVHAAHACVQWRKADGREC